MDLGEKYTMKTMGQLISYTQDENTFTLQYEKEQLIIKVIREDIINFFIPLRFKEHYSKAVGSTKDYPMREFLNARLKVTVNTDNRTVSNTTLTKELEFIQKTYGITDEEIHLMMRNAVDVAFADDAVKERMLKYV